MAKNEQYDVVVIGAGPAGSTAAGFVRQAGYEVLLLDREEFPRFRIGESLMPACYWTLERLGVLPKMKSSHYPKKYSVQFVGKSGRSGIPFYFDEVDNHESAQTWQVERSEFDQMLLDHARALGAEIRLGVNVKDVVLEDGRVAGVVIDSGDGGRQTIRSKVVIDASGQTALMSRKFGLKQTDPLLKHCAFFTRYRGAHRDSGKDEGATLILRTSSPKTWFWYIPLPDDEVSVGVVGPIEQLLKGRDRKPEQVFAEEAAECPALLERIRDAEQSMDLMVMRDFSYVSTRIAGDGWVSCGDAFGFLDPIYSSGVFLALKSAEMAADSVVAGLEQGDLSGRVLGRHGEEYLSGMEAMRKLVYAYYDEKFSFAGFLEKHPEARDGLVNLLVGNVYRESCDALFEAMQKTLSLPEERKLQPLEEMR